MKVHELSAGDIFYAYYARTKKVWYGPYRLEGSIHLVPHWAPIYKATRVVGRSASYFPGSMECIKVGIVPDEAR